MKNRYVNDFNDTTQTYINELSEIKYEPIPKEIEDDLIKKIQNGDNHAQKQLLDAHLRLVVNIAKKYKGTGVEMSELISEGNMGLITALERFDPERGVRLCSYAVHWIMKYMLNIINERIKTNNNVVSISEFIEDDETDNYSEFHNNTLETDETNSTDTNLDEDYNKIVDTLLGSLDSRSKYIIEHFYGLNNKELLTIKEMSDELKISTERIRQIKTKAMMTLRSQALVNNISLTNEN